MSEKIKDAQTKFSATLESAAAELATKDRVTVRHLLELVGEQGLLILCMILMLPFLLPISVPGVSTVFSVVVILVGISVTFNWLWLPERIMHREIDAASMVNAMKNGARTFARIDGVIRPRLLFMTGNRAINRVNGLMFIYAGILLIFPLSLVPLSNTLPGLAVLFLAAGMIQRDGFFILGGYVMNIVSTLYFGLLGVGLIAAGRSISTLFGS